ncbi:MAG: hypothetical protein H0U62_06150, partial [Actinobacteria bacterium]|nr:hypothetical protein [Actinomycetota bacterium]
GLRDVGRGDLGIGVQGLVDRAVVSGNQSRRQPPDSDEGRGEWVAILVGTLRGEVPVDVTGEFVTGFVRVRVFTVGPQAAFVATRRRASVTVEGNIAEAGRSDRPAILVAVDGDVVAHGNQCLKFLDEESQAALFVQADAGTVNGNRCVGGLPTAASLMVDPARLAVLGNVVSSEFIEVPGGLASPWQELNVYNVP